MLTGDAVVIARMHHGESWLAAFDKASGKLLWKVARNYQTPVEGDNAYPPLSSSGTGPGSSSGLGRGALEGSNAADGRLLWSCGDFDPRAVANGRRWPLRSWPVTLWSGVACGRADRGQPRLYGIRLGGTGDVTATTSWKREDTGTFVPTPAEYKGGFTSCGTGGEIECLDPATGKTIWKDAFPKASSNYYASPLVAGGKLYAIREDGVVFVAAVEGKFAILAENHMGERVIASPVAVSEPIAHPGRAPAVLHTWPLTSTGVGAGGGT